jgi:hypothetical protein
LRARAVVVMASSPQQVVLIVSRRPVDNSH